MTIQYILKDQAQLNTTIADLSDNNTGLSFLFYALVQANTLDYKGDKSETLKRLVGSKLFPLVPMGRYKKADQDKAIYQYNRKGSSQMIMSLDEQGFDSISAMLDIEINSPNDYYPEFATKVMAWVDAQETKRKEVAQVKKAEEKAEEVTKESEHKAKQDELVRKAGLIGTTAAELEIRLVAIEKRQMAIQLLLDLGHGEMVAELQLINESELQVVNV